MKRKVISTIKIGSIIYLALCIFLYFFQEKLIFFPEKLDKNYQFKFDNNFDEIFIKTKSGNNLNGLLFKANSAKGLIFYLHGNAGNLNNWGELAKTYTNLHYDVFILDYPGFGKSDGSINSQSELFDDIQNAYNEVAARYSEEKIIILGYSIGTGLAAKLASANNPKHLILQAPYYSLTDMMKHTYAIIPTFILKYKFETNEYIKSCKMPITIFHGNKDEVIYYESSVKLKANFKATDTLITLNNQGHNEITKNIDYLKVIGEILK